MQRTCAEWKTEGGENAPFSYGFFICILLLPVLQGQKNVLAIAEEVSDLEKAMGLDSTIMDGESSLKFGLMEVVYEWAGGMVWGNCEEKGVQSAW